MIERPTRVTGADFDPASPEFQHDPHATWARLRSDCPVARGGPLSDWWALACYDDIVAAATDDRTFTSTRGVNIGEGTIGPPRFPMHYDPPQQTHYRRLMNAPFLDANVLPLEPAFRTNTVALLEPLLASGQRRDGPGLHVAAGYPQSRHVSQRAGRSVRRAVSAD